MDIEITYDDIITRCEQLSSFEARGKIDANGESRYLEIHINEVDKLLVKQYIEQARDTLGEAFGRMITNITLNQDNFVWSIRTDTRWNGAMAFTKHVNEAIASYTMAHWLSGRLDERVAFYENLFAASTAMATKNIFTKQPPQK